MKKNEIFTAYAVKDGKGYIVSVDNLEEKFFAHGYDDDPEKTKHNILVAAKNIVMKFYNKNPKAYEGFKAITQNNMHDRMKIEFL